MTVGSAEVTQLIVNTKILVQMTEEIIVLQLIPNLLSFIGLIGVFTGVTIMIFTKEESNLKYVSNKAEDVYIEISKRKKPSVYD